MALGRYQALRESWSNKPPILLCEASRSILSRLDNRIEITSTNGHLRDFRGLIGLMDFQEDEAKMCKIDKSPTRKMLEIWENRQGENRPTLDILLSYLEEMDRHDIIQDLEVTLNFNVEIIRREEWGSCYEDVKANPLKTPIRHIIICHSVSALLYTKEQCLTEMRRIQQICIQKKLGDMAYNFVIGPDGRVYEGLGWEYVGGHTIGWNHRSYGIAFMGDFNNERPTSDMLRAAVLLIELGKDLGYIADDYFLHGHRDVSKGHPESPGKELYAIIGNWPHYQANP